MGLMILLGLAAWIATSTIVEAEIFRDVREAIEKLHNNHSNWLTYKLKYLIGCHMCTGIWVASVIALFVAPIASSGIVGWGLTALAIKGIAHLFLVVHKLGDSYTDLNNRLALIEDNDIEDDDNPIPYEDEDNPIPYTEFPHQEIRDKWNCLESNK